MNIIRFDNISKSFAGKKVLNNLSFSVDRAEVYGLLGPNGCGKSTTINILCNLLDPDTGKVWIGNAVPGNSNHIIGYCPQEIALYRDLRPAENLRFFAQIYGLSKADQERRIAELTRLFGFDQFARTPVGSLSGGWQRRVSIAAAIIHEPEIVVLDEPTSAVDIEARHELWQLIETLRDQGTTILLTTHHLDEAERLCSRIGIMKEGCIAKEGTIAELLSMVPGKKVAVIETRFEKAITQRASELGWTVRHYAGKIACLLTEDVTLNTVIDAFSGIEISAVSIQNVSLEHAFLEIIRQDADARI